MQSVWQKFFRRSVPRIIAQRIERLAEFIPSKERLSLNWIERLAEFIPLKVCPVPVAQLDRASGFGPEGCGFNPCRAHFARETRRFWVQILVGAQKNEEL